MKKTIITLIILAVIAIVAIPRIIEYRNNPETEEVVRPLTVEGQVVERADIEVYANVIGDSAASSSVPVMVSVPAKATEIHAKVGDHVEKDDILFVLDGDDVAKQVTQSELAVEQARAALSQANTGIKSAQQGLANAKLSYEMAVSNYNINLANYEYSADNLASFKVLYDEGIVSRSEYDQMSLQASPETRVLLDKQLEQASSAQTQAQLGLEQAQAGYRQAEAGVKQAQQGLDNARETLDDLTVKAPVAGYVTMMNAEKDVIVSSAQAAAMIEDVDRITVTVSVTAELVGKVSAGDVVKVAVSALDNTYEGTVETVALSADSMTMLYPVEITVENRDHKIKPGMFATVDLLSESALNVLVVPNDAIISRGGQSVVYVQIAENDVEARTIETGLASDYYTEVVSGLEEGDVVIVKGVGLIGDDTVLNIVRGDE